MKKHLLSLFIVAILTTPIIAQTLSVSEANRILGTLNSVFENEDYNTILEKSSLIVAQYPNAVAAYNARSSAFNKLGIPELALNDAETVLSIDSNNSEALTNKEHAVSMLRKYGSTLESLNKAIKADAKNGILYNLRGNYYFEKEEYVKALEDFSKSISFLNKGYYFSDSMEKIGNISFLNKDYSKAMLCYKKALKYKNFSPELYNFIALTYSELGDNSNAVKNANNAIKLAPNEPLLYYNRGLFYSEMERHKEAVDDFNHSENLGILETPISKAEFYASRAEAYSKLGKNKEAIADYTKAIQFDNANAELYLYRFTLYMSQKDFKNADADLSKIIELKPKESETLLKYQEELRRNIRQ